MPKNYIPRIMDKILEERLSFKSAVLIEGPKWCGKTTTAKQISKSVLAMDQPDLARSLSSTIAFYHACEGTVFMGS